MKKINLIHKIAILSLSAFFVLSGCTNTEASNTEVSNTEVSNTEVNIYAVGGPMKYDSDGNPLYNEYGPEFEKKWKSKDGNIEIILNNMLGIEGRGRYQGTYIYKKKSYEVEFSMEPDDLLISAENIAYDDNDNSFILSGTFIKNDENDEFTLEVKEVYGKVKTKTNDIISSVYKVGDKIIFNQVND